MAHSHNSHLSPASIEVQVKLTAGARVPENAHEGDAGMDLAASLDQPVTLVPGQRQLIPTGVFLAIPEGYEGQIRPRSGLALRHGVTVLNTPGTVDAPYRGELRVLLINLGQDPFVIEPGMRIAQLVVAACARVRWIPVDRFADSARGEGGFGSTGL